MLGTHTAHSLEDATCRLYVSPEALGYPGYTPQGAPIVGPGSLARLGEDGTLQPEPPAGKEEPTKRLLKELAIEVQILGTMVSESRQRWFR